MQGIDLTQVYQSNVPAVVRLTALELSKALSYTKPGAWLKNLSDMDLEYLISMVDRMDEAPDNPYVHSLILLSMILAQAEGVEADSTSSTRQHVNVLVHLMVVESLHRKGAVEVEYNNMSFGEDAKDLPIVRAKV